MYVRDEEVIKKAVELRKQGLSLVEVAEKCGCSASSVNRWSKIPPKKRVNETYWNNPEFVKKVGEMLEKKPDITRQEIADKLGVSGSTISRTVTEFFPEKRWYKTSLKGKQTVVKKNYQQVTDTTKFLEGMQTNKKIEAIKKNLKIGQVIKLGGKVGRVVSKYEHLFVVETNKGYKVCFGYSELLPFVKK